MPPGAEIHYDHRTRAGQRIKALHVLVCAPGVSSTGREKALRPPMAVAVGGRSPAFRAATSPRAFMTASVVLLM